MGPISDRSTTKPTGGSQMTKIKLSVRISSKISKGSESSNVNYDIDTEEIQSSIKTEVYQAFQQMEAKLRDELGETAYGDKQSNLDDYS